MIDPKVLVPIPDAKGVHVKKAGAKGERYVYQTVRSYRDKNGKPQHDTICLGKQSTEPGMMYPNERYREIFGDSKERECQPDRMSSYQYGLTYLALRVSKDLGLTDDLTAVFKEKARVILSIAIYMMRNGTATGDMADWQEDVFFPYYIGPVTSSAAEGIFKSLTETRRNDFFQRWIRRNHSDDSLCLDSPDMGIFCTADTHVPVYCVLHDKSLNDRRNMEVMLQSAAEMGIKNIHLFVDGDYWSEKALKALKGCKTFTVTVPLGNAFARSAVEEVQKSITDFRYVIPELDISAMELQKTAFGFAGRLAVYYDTARYYSQCSSLNDLLGRKERELSDIKNFSAANKREYTRFFEIKPVKGEGGFTYSFDNEKINRIRRCYGYTLLFSTDEEQPLPTLLRCYREKDADEELFRYERDDRSGVHPEEVQGKIFVQFLAVILRARFQNVLKGYLDSHSLSLSTVLLKLSNIRIVLGDGTPHLESDLTREQREILTLFDAFDSLMDSLTKAEVRDYHLPCIG